MSLNKRDLKKSIKSKEPILWGIVEKSKPKDKTLDDFLKSDTMNVTRKNDSS